MVLMTWYAMASAAPISIVYRACILDDGLRDATLFYGWLFGGVTWGFDALSNVQTGVCHFKGAVPRRNTAVTHRGASSQTTI